MSWSDKSLKDSPAPPIQQVKGRAEIGKADGGKPEGGSARYTMTKANPRGADFVNRETRGSGPMKGTNTADPKLMGDQDRWSNPKDGRGF